MDADRHTCVDPATPGEVKGAWCLLLVTAVFLATTAFGEETLKDAERLMRQGEEAYERGELSEARKAYEGALKIRERLAQTEPRHERLGELP